MLQPENYKNRRELMASGIETVKALWRGEAVKVVGGDGQPVEVKTLSTSSAARTQDVGDRKLCTRTPSRLPDGWASTC